MSEYWKSTPKYWCKHCSIYVRDTKLERQNHEATAKHQGALKRFLRDLHRNHEQEQREKERAKREIERLNGVVNAASDHAGNSSNSSTGGRVLASSQTQVTGVQRQQQWEQLAEMGIDVPTELRRDMAMAGEWTVTNSRIIDDTQKTDNSSAKPPNVEAIASGIRKRPKSEAEEKQEEENAIRGLFKKPRRWGRDIKQAPEDDTELDALLSRTLTNPPKTEEQYGQPPKREEYPRKIKEENPSFGNKKEEIDESRALPYTKPATAEETKGISIKQEENTGDVGPAVIFKKRKPKNIRQR